MGDDHHDGRGASVGWIGRRVARLLESPAGPVLRNTKRRVGAIPPRVSNAMQLAGWSRSSGPPTVAGATSTSRAPSEGEAVPVVLCVWQRIDRLERTIALLSEQSHADVELLIWNNNKRERSTVDAIVRAATGLSIRVTHSSRNIGGFGRFYLARAVAARHPFVVFVDDDQTFSRTMIADLLAEARPSAIMGNWAFRLLSTRDYGARVPARVGERVDYCGTGGMVADTRVFLESGLFDCPRRFWFVEDLWLSFYASHRLGWDLLKSGVPFEMDDDGKDQFLFLHGTKSALLRRLVRSGWRFPSAARPPH